MSSLWTPGGERPVGRQPQPEPEAQAGPGQQRLDPETEAELAEMQRQIAEAPAWAVVANHAIGLFQLAGVHLSQQPPKLEEARLAIDGMAALVEGLEGRLGPEEVTLKDALAQIRLAFVQIQAGSGGGVESHPEPPDAGAGGAGGDPWA
ncbi:MAG: hypothetical protein ACRDJP_13380 [Actinomycetota bacterium]